MKHPDPRNDPNRPPDWSGFITGMKTAIGVPGLVMSGSFIGFGALVGGSGLSLGHGLFMTFTMWALPAQVLFVQLYKQGAPVLAIALAVSLTAVRLMPMVVGLLPRVRMRQPHRLLEFIAAHFIAATVWILAFLHFEHLDRAQRMPFILGVSAALFSSMLGLTAAGYYLVHELPPLAAAGLIFLTPAFFFISLIAGAKRRTDLIAIMLGAILGPIAYSVAPGFDMLIAGLAGGTLAFFISGKINGTKK
ncbi:MAG TPA: branched-chain amino acid ABC transporter permease [Rhizobiales bacterium]|nr:branched-chain amino acid ABC transporter permease [Hyphomicrobiales bacterium]